MKHLKKTQIAVGNYTYPLFPFTYFLDSMVRMGVKNIELWAAEPHLYLEDMEAGCLEKMKREIDERNLKLVCLTPEQCMYPVNLGAEEERVRVRSIEYFRKALAAARILEASAVLVTPGNGYRHKDTKEETFKRTSDSLRLLSEEAGRLGIQLFLEHLTAETTNIAVRASELFRLMQSVGHPALKCMADVDMLSRCGESVEDYLKVCNNDLAHVHLVDGMPGGHLALGDGVLPLERELGHLDKAGYEGYITLEIIDSRYHLNPDEAVMRSLDWLRTRL